MVYMIEEEVKKITHNTIVEFSKIKENLKDIGLKVFGYKK